MGKISSGTGEEVTVQSAKQGSEGQDAGHNLDGSINGAKSAADNFLSEVKTIEIGLETKVIELQSQIAGYELAVKSGQLTERRIGESARL